MAGFDLVQMIEGQEAVISELSAGLATSGRIYRQYVCDGDMPKTVEIFEEKARRQQFALVAAREVRAYLQVQFASEMLAERQRNEFGGCA